MRSFRLSTLLAILNIGLLLLAVAGVAGVAVTLLRDFADTQARAQVTQALLTAQQAIRQEGLALQTSARLLAARPPLRDLAQTADQAALAELLDDFQRTSQVAGCAVFRGGQLLAASGSPQPWLAIRQRHSEGSGLLIARLAPDAPLLLSALAVTSGPDPIEIVVVTPLDAPRRAALDAQAGLAVSVTPLEQQLPVLGVTRDDAAGVYRASAPLALANEPPAALLAVALPTTRTDTPLRQLVAAIGLVALVMVALAGGVSLLVGRRLSRPLKRLTLAAGRIGSGDLVTPVPPAAGQETGTLSRTLEEMRLELLRRATELEAVRRVRDSVLANISHEFRTPLSAQLASIELLLEQLPDLSTVEIAQLVHSLQRGTTRLTRLIDNLLESVRVDSGNLRIRRQPVALDEVVEEAVELTRPLLSQVRQEVVVELPYPLPPLLADGPRLSQVFVNLLANANKYAPPGTTIAIGGQVQPDQIALWVTNEQSGPPPAIGVTMFDRFVRAAADEPEQRGMGLGLWIVKSIIERHGGSVRASNDGAITQIIVVLPRSQEERDEDPNR